MSDTSKREELIEEAAKAIGEVTYTTSNDQVRAARAALAVFEQAHTPTTDEREALARAVFIASDDFAFADRMAKAWDAPGPHGRARWYRYADAILAAGFRRTAVQEPSAEPQHDDSCAERCNHCAVCGTGIMYGSRCPEHYLNQPQGEPTPINGKWVCGKCAREVALGHDDGQIPEHHRTCSKRAQGEPSDAEVKAAAEVLLHDYQMQYDGGHLDEFTDLALAALRAAYETRGEGR